MEAKNFLSRLKNKWLLLYLLYLLYLALVIPGLIATCTNQIKTAEVKGIQTVVTVAPTIIPTETPIPTHPPTPTDTPTATPTAIPTLAPTDTPYPQRIYTAPTATPVPPTQAPATQSTSQLDNNNSYTNSAGDTLHSPANTVDGSVPAGATARCADGTYSFSASRRGTCSHHGGVAAWL